LRTPQGFGLDAALLIDALIRSVLLPSALKLHLIPRTSPAKVEPMLEAGAEGAVVSFADEAAMRDFALHYS